MSEISGLFRYFFVPAESPAAVWVLSAAAVSEFVFDVLLWQALPTANGRSKASVRHEDGKNWGAFFIDGELAGRRK
jgi:hypothetical protein